MIDKNNNFLLAISIMFFLSGFPVKSQPGDSSIRSFSNQLTFLNFYDTHYQSFLSHTGLFFFRIYLSIPISELLLIQMSIFFKISASGKKIRDNTLRTQRVNASRLKDAWV